MANGQNPGVLWIQLYVSVGHDPATSALVPTQPVSDVPLPSELPSLYLLDEIWLYAQLTGPAGTHDLSAECRLPGTPFVIGKLPELRSRFPGGGLVEVAFRFQQLPLPMPGRYEFLVLANGQPLDPTAHLVVR